MLAVDLRQLIVRLADRRTGRTEANVQSDLHMLLTTAPLQADEHLKQVARTIAVGTIELQLWGLFLVGAGTIVMAVSSMFA